MKKGIKYFLWVVLIILVAIQFVPVDRENPIGDKNNDFLVQTQAPADVQALMKNACYDCHSNETVWPKYAYVAPISFLIAKHVEEGRDHLNFSDWATFDPEDHPYILKHMKKAIDKGAMPMAAYVKLHPDAEMNDERKALVLGWIDSLLETYDPVK